MHNIMDEHILSIVRSCSRDEQSYQTLKQIVNILQGERDHYRKYMDLLERAVRNDYEAIMITEASFEGSDPVIAFVNEGFSRMTGFGREEVAGLTPRILHGKKTDQSVLHQMRQKLMDGESFFGETVTYRRDGTEFVNQWDVHPLKDQGGEITHWVSYQQDVTQQRALEQHYNSRKREWDNLSEELRNITALLDSEGRLLEATPAFRDLIQSGSGELEHLRFQDLLFDSDRSRISDLFDEVKKFGAQGLEFNLTLITSQNKRVEVSACASMIRRDGEARIHIRFRNSGLRQRVDELLQAARHRSLKLNGRPTAV